MFYPIYDFKTFNFNRTFEQVNKKVGEGLATAIETGEKATEKTKKTLGKQNQNLWIPIVIDTPVPSGETTQYAKAKGERAKEGADQMGQKAKKAGNDVRAHYPPL